jgi:putative ABC transport system permease protein
VGAGELESAVDDTVADALRQIDGVADVVGVRLANWHFRGGPVVIDAFDPAYFTTPVFGEWPLLGARAPDAWARVADGSGIVVSSNLVRNVGVQLDDTIELETPNGPLALRVVGVTTDFASPRGTIEMSRAIFARYWNDHRVTRFFVDAAPDAERERVRAAIEHRLGAGEVGWRIISSGDLVDHFAGQVRRAFASVYVLGAVILAVILFGIVDNLSASVSERTRELGMLRALGLRRAVMWQLVVAEALVLSTLGLLLALLQGALVGIVWIKSTIPNVLGWVIDLDVPIVLTIGVVLLTTALCMLAALVPGRRAAALEPALAIRWE